MYTSKLVSIYNVHVHVRAQLWWALFTCPCNVHVRVLYMYIKIYTCTYDVHVHVYMYNVQYILYGGGISEAVDCRLYYTLCMRTAYTCMYMYMHMYMYVQCTCTCIHVMCMLTSTMYIYIIHVPTSLSYTHTHSLSPPNPARPVQHGKMKFLCIATKTSIDVYAWAQKPYSKFMQFKSFPDITHRPLLIDMVCETPSKAKVLYASSMGQSWSCDCHVMIT